MYAQRRGLLRACPMLPTRWSSAMDILKRRQQEEQRDLEALRDLQGDPAPSEMPPRLDATPSPPTANDGE